MPTLPNGRFTSESAWSMRQRRCSLARNRFWESLGYPNLQRATARRMALRAEKRQAEQREKALEQTRKALESTGDW